MVVSGTAVVTVDGDVVAVAGNVVVVVGRVEFVGEDVVDEVLELVGTVDIETLISVRRSARCLDF